MAHFYGTLEGQRGPASRLGGKRSGLTTRALSWQGGVRVHLYYDAATERDMALITLCPHPSTGRGTQRVLYDGPVSGLAA